MDQFSVGQVHEIAAARAAQLVRDLRESNKNTYFKPIVEPESMMASFTQMVARYLMDTCKIVPE
jgi:hypothetical protein